MRSLLTCLCIVLAIAVGGQAVPGQNITFVLSGHSLSEVHDNYSPPDTFVKLYSYTGKNATTAEELTRFGTTEVVDNSANPAYPNVFWFWYEPGNQQKWRFVVKDHDVFDVDEEVGSVDVDVDNFVSQRSGNLNVTLNQGGGSLKIQRTYPLTFKLRATHLPPKDRSWFSVGLSDPYVMCYYKVGRNAPESQEVLFYTTNVISDVESPIWDEVVEFPQYQMGADQYLIFKLYDSDSLSADDFLGETALIPADRLGKKEGSVRELLHRSNGRAQLTVELF